MTQPTDSIPVSAVRCPHCGAEVPSGQRHCPDCGVDLLLAVDLLFRQRLNQALSAAPPAPSSAEELVPRLGDVLVQEKLISPSQLEQALEAQSQAATRGQPRRLGELLIAQGLLTPKDLDRVVARQIAQLQTALQSANQTLEQRVRERTAELTRALERLSELNLLKANFVANISHELRTPLAHIVGYVELLSEHALGPLSPEQEKAVVVMQRASLRLQGLIDDLIQFAAAARGAISLQLDNHAPGELIREARARLQPKATAANIKVSLRVPPSLPPIRVDRAKIEWVVSQLLDNAIKFSRPGGHVTVRAEADSSLVRIQVTDTGIGIAQARLAEIFEPFHQLDGSSTRRYGGTGLGLALARQIVEAHGTHLQVKSQEGAGSTFEFAVPVAGEAEQART